MPRDELDCGPFAPPFNTPISDAFLESTLRVLRRFWKLPASDILFTFCRSELSSMSPKLC